MVHVVVAPDKFKGSLTGRQAAEAVAVGLHRARPEIPVRLVPVADGGDGTLDAALAAGFHRIEVDAHGPTGATLRAAIAVRDGVAVVETAAACGLACLPGGVPAPLSATSFGAGELLRAALDADCHTVLLGLGGSASTDGGAGMVAALGGRLCDVAGRDLPPGGAALANLATIDLSTLDPRLATVRLLLASDVDNPLLGPHGAAAVFGPQKGASPAQVRLLERGLSRWARLVDTAVGGTHTTRPGAGAAGGLGFGALAALGAIHRPGIDLMLDLVNFAEQLVGARLVITGEGSLDEQTPHGKAPVGVATAARKAGIPVVAVAGQCALTGKQLADIGIVTAYPLTDLEPDVDRCIGDAETLLATIAERVANDWLTPSRPAAGSGHDH